LIIRLSMSSQYESFCEQPVLCDETVVEDVLSVVLSPLLLGPGELMAHGNRKQQGNS
jgi:hypothetical protein